MRAFILILLAIPLPALAVAPKSPPSCRPITRSKLGEHLRETVWEITRARAKLDRALLEHNQRCRKVRGELTETRELSTIERLAEEARRTHAELLDLEDEYLRTARTASEAAHLLQEGDCEERILEQRRKLENEIGRKTQEVGVVLNTYCR